jgi:hypothetical protein
MERTAPYNRAKAITASDSVNFLDPQGNVDLTDAVYVGGAGNIIAVLEDGKTVTLTGVIAGAIYPIRLKRVNSTSTTATALVALYYQ